MNTTNKVEEIITTLKSYNLLNSPHPNQDDDEVARSILTQYHQDLMSEVVGKLEIEKRKHNCPPDDGNDYDHGAYVALTEAQNIIKSK